MPRPLSQRSFIPASDAAFDAWFTEFNGTVQESAFTTFNGTTAMQGSISTLHANWAAAFLDYEDKSARSPAVVEAKNVAKANALIGIRSVAKVITALIVNLVKTGVKTVEAGVAELMALGLTVPASLNPTGTDTRKKRQVPKFPPIIEVTSDAAGQLILSYENGEHLNPGENELSRKKIKPRGVTGIEFMLRFPSIPEGSAVSNVITKVLSRTPDRMTLPEAYKGRPVHVIGRYVGTGSDASSWSEEQITTVPGKPMNVQSLTTPTDA